MKLTKQFNKLKKRTKKENANLVLNIGKYLLSAAIGFTLNYYLGSTFYYFAFAILFGLVIPKLVINRWGHNKKIIDKIVWLNLILGLFYTPLGILYGVFTIKYNTLLPKQDEMNKYKTLGIMGIAISIINSISVLIAYYIYAK